MADTAADRATAVTRVLEITSGSDPSVQKAALKALVREPDQSTANSLWLILTVGLLVLLAISLGGLLYMVGDGKESTSPDLVVTAFTALLTGLLGFFIKSPTQGT